MCTVHTFDLAARQDHLRQIKKDWSDNSDGGSVVFIKNGTAFLRVQCLRLKDLVGAISSVSADRYVVHLRAASTQAEGLVGCHMFDSPDGLYTFCHNGVISGKAAAKFRVDSMVLGQQLEADDYPRVEGKFLPNWSSYRWCNVIAVDNLSGETYVHRSVGGSLHTDGKGNWATRQVNSKYVYVDRAGWYSVQGDVLHHYGDEYHYSPVQVAKMLGMEDEDVYGQCECCRRTYNARDLWENGLDICCWECLGSISS